MRCVILYGGVSAEHDVTLRSCHFILQQMNRRWDPLLIGISKSGTWYQQDTKEKLAELKSSDQLSICTKNQVHASEVFKAPGNLVVWPMLHGPFGEDGKIQGLLESHHVAYVGCDVLGSSVAMHKSVAKNLAKASGVTIGAAKHIRKQAWQQNKQACLQSIAAELSGHLYVKPVAMGSSIGISRVESSENLEKAIELAFEYDTECIIEEEIKGREIELAVFGGRDELTVSEPGEIVKENSFYDYKEKYSKNSTVQTKIPANLKPSVVNALKEDAARLFEALHLYGLARMDFFVTDDDVIYFNEANTMPGFTSISLYPRLMEHAGKRPSELIDELIQLGIARQQENSQHQND